MGGGGWEMENRICGDTILNQWELNVMLHRVAVHDPTQRHSQPSLLFPSTQTHTHTSQVYY